MEKVTMPPEFLAYELECDKHNLQQSINLMIGLDNKLMYFARKLSKDIRSQAQMYAQRINDVTTR
jgi:hypothetical protein